MTTKEKIATLEVKLKQAEHHIDLRNRVLHLVKNKGPLSRRFLFGPVLHDSDVSQDLLSKMEKDGLIDHDGENILLTELGKKLYFGLSKSGWKYKDD